MKFTLNPPAIVVSRHFKNHSFILLIFVVLFITRCAKEEVPNPLAPSACFDVPAGNLFVDVSINFNASCSKNSFSYKWEFSDGWTSSLKEVNRTFTKSGNYTLSLTVTDSLGLSNKKSESFIVQPSPYIIHEGTINTNEVWVEGLHLIKNNVTIDGGSVVIEPGATIFFNKGKSIYVGNNFFSSSTGLLKAVGTTVKPIKFLPVTGIQAPGEWGHIYFTKNASPLSSLIFCNIQFGGKADSYQFDDSYLNHGVLDIDNCSVSIENTTIHGGINFGIRLQQGGNFNTFTNNTLTGNAGNPIKIEVNWAHTIGGNNNIQGAKNILLYTRNYLQSNATWKKQTVGYEFSDIVFIGSAYSTNSYNLTLEPGVKLLFRKGTFMEVETLGKLTATGTLSEPILFSSAEPIKAKGDWRNVLVFGACSFSYCKFEYGGSLPLETTDWFGMLTISSKTTTVNNCTFSASASDGLSISSGDLVNSSNNVFSDCDGYGLTVAAHIAHLVNNTHTFNSNKNIHIRAMPIDLNVNATWPKRIFPYYFSGEFDITNNALGAGSLTIEAGAEIRFLPGSQIIVGGNFVADGTTSPIILTLDEAYRTIKEKYWKGIFFAAGTSATSKMINCKISYAGYNPGYPYIGIIHCSGTVNKPTIMNNEITNSASHGISLDMASPILSGNIFSGNSLQNIYTVIH
ncbi:MAG: PKD domain-containing protein [Methanococcaceae archaeon]